MANTPTTNYGFPKPGKGDYGDSWIADYNAKLDGADTSLHDAITTGVDPGHHHSQLWASDGSPQAVSINADGKMGVGTISPNSQFTFYEVNGVDTANLEISNAGNIGGRIKFGYNDGTFNAQIRGFFDGAVGATLVFEVGYPTPIEAMRIRPNGVVNITYVPVFADNTAALAGGLVAGDIYRTSVGVLMVAY